MSLTARQARASFERRLAEAGASFATWMVLEMLSARGPMIQRDLAEVLDVSGQTLTRHIDRLVASGWLRRADVVHDRRATLLEVTAEGAEAHRRLAGVARQANAQLARGLSAQEKNTLDRLLERVAANASRE